MPSIRAPTVSELAGNGGHFASAKSVDSSQTFSSYSLRTNGASGASKASGASPTLTALPLSGLPQSTSSCVPPPSTASFSPSLLTTQTPRSYPVAHLSDTHLNDAQQYEASSFNAAPSTTTPCLTTSPLTPSPSMSAPESASRVIVRERVVDVPEVRVKKVPYDTYVDVVQIREKIVYKDVVQDRVVVKPHLVVRNVEKILEPIKRRIPVPLEAVTTCQFVLPRIVPKYKVVKVPVTMPRFVPVPVPADQVKPEQLAKMRKLLKSIDRNARRGDMSLSKLVELSKLVKALDIDSCLLKNDPTVRHAAFPASSSYSGDRGRERERERGRSSRHGRRGGRHISKSSPPSRAALRDPSRPAPHVSTYAAFASAANAAVFASALASKSLTFAPVSATSMNVQVVEPSLAIPPPCRRRGAAIPDPIDPETVREAEQRCQSQIDAETQISQSAQITNPIVESAQTVTMQRDVQGMAVPAPEGLVTYRLRNEGAAGKAPAALTASTTERLAQPVPTALAVNPLSTLAPRATPLGVLSGQTAPLQPFIPLPSSNAEAPSPSPSPSPSASLSPSASASPRFNLALGEAALDAQASPRLDSPAADSVTISSSQLGFENSSDCEIVAEALREAAGSEAKEHGGDREGEGEGEAEGEAEGVEAVQVSTSPASASTPTLTSRAEGSEETEQPEKEVEAISGEADEEETEAVEIQMCSD